MGEGGGEGERGPDGPDLCLMVGSRRMSGMTGNVLLAENDEREGGGWLISGTGYGHDCMVEGEFAGKTRRTGKTGYGPDA